MYFLRADMRKVREMQKEKPEDGSSPGLKKV
jgi:hypothetical protein